MNRFRELKQKLIKSKRDSQKLQQIQQDQKVIQNWIEKELQYYGINKESYKLPQLRSLSQFYNKQSINHQQVKVDPFIKKNHILIKQQQSSASQTISQSQQQPQFVQLLLFDSKSKNNNDNSSKLSNSSSNKSKQNKDDSSEQNTKAIQQSSNQTSSENISQSIKRKGLICKKSTKTSIEQKQSSLTNSKHNYSMNQLDNFINKKQNNDILMNYNNKSEKNHQYISDAKIHHGSVDFKASQNQNQFKQLDYYTLILQLTAELNYSRLNKQHHNQKSILKQIKNLIEFIEGSDQFKGNGSHSNSIMSRFERSKEHQQQKFNSSQKEQFIFKSNKKSNHTFSSICSDDGMMQRNQFHFVLQQEQDEDEQFQDEKKVNYEVQNQSGEKNRNRKIKYKLIEKSEFNYEEQEQNQHDRTFQSGKNCHEQRNSDEEVQNEDKSNQSIIDMVEKVYDQNQNQLQDYSNQRQQFNSKNLVENSPLSRITQRESQYIDSMNPSLHTSPRNQITPIKLSTNFRAQFIQPPSNTLQKYPQSDEKKLFEKTCLLQNQIILKKLSDRLQNTQQSNLNVKSLFEQSLQYKRILYILDSEYNDSGMKTTKKLSELFVQSPPSSQQQSSDKSFLREVFQSFEENCEKKQNEKDQKCLMKNLQNMFQNQLRGIQDFQVQLINKNKSYFQTLEEHKKSSKQTSQQHKRSKTTSDHFSSQPSCISVNNTRKYHLNLFSQLSKQLVLESRQQNELNGSNRQKNDEESRYHKVSHNSYLSSSSIVNKQNSVVSSDSQLKVNQKNLVNLKNMKKNVLQINITDEAKPRFIVKKKKKQNFSQSISQIEQLSLSDRKNSQKTEEVIQKINIMKQQKRKLSKQNKINVKQKQNIVIKKELNTENIKQKHNISSSSSEVSQNSKANMKNSSPNSSSRQIKYKVYQSGHPASSSDDKRKVLKDIVSMLNTKYHKNIEILR